MMARAPRGLLLLSALLGAYGESPHLGRDVEEDHIGNLCDGEHDGWHCRHGIAVQCSGERTVDHRECTFFQECKDDAGQASCEEDACEGKADGFHCFDDHVVECRGRRTVDFTECQPHQECKHEAASSSSASCQEKVCDGKADGKYCHSDHTVVECRGFVAVDSSTCQIYERCEDLPSMGSAQCQEHDCLGKADGSYCHHGGVIQCVGSRTVSFAECPFYQECSRGGRHVAHCEEDACDSESDGWRCKGNHMVLCSGSRTVDFRLCPGFTECEKEDGQISCSGDRSFALRLPMRNLLVVVCSWAVACSWGHTRP